MTVQLKKSWTVEDLIPIGKDLGMDISKTDRNIEFEEVVAAETAAPRGLAVASSPAQIQMALKSPKALIVVPLQALAHPALQPHISRLVGCQNPGLFWGRALETFHPCGRDLQPSVSRHPTAVIDATAQIDPTAIIEAHCVIGPEVKIMAHTWIGPQCVVEDHAVIGEYSRLQAHVFIGARTLIGRRVHIKPSTVIGSAGFGLSHDQNGHHHAIPQVGRVVIEDDVFIGALCNIDRATLNETRIGTGTKLDSLVHIAHNCIIGKHTILTGGVAIAGSTTVGDHCVFGGRCTISDHVTICDNVQLAGLSGVNKDITEPGAYGGFPLQKLKDFLRSSVSIVQLPHLRKEVGTILRHLGLKESP